jgi:hypothetical protein
VREFLEAGSPRLALARARGTRFAPWLLPITATFPDSTVSTVPEVGSPIKCTQDTYIDDVDVQLQNGNSPISQFSTLSDYLFNAQSGITATLDIQGAPRYPVAPKFVPLTAIRNLVRGSSMKWILTYTQQPMMAFNATVALPDANLPTTINVTFRGWVPIVDEYIDMDKATAVRLLKSEFGIDCDPMLANGCK